MEEKSRLIALPKILDKRGNLSFIESLQHIPFEIKRAHGFMMFLVGKLEEDMLTLKRKNL